MRDQGQSNIRVSQSKVESQQCFNLCRLSNGAVACMPAIEVQDVAPYVISDFVFSLRALKESKVLENIVVDFTLIARLTDDIAQELVPLLARGIKEKKEVVLVGANEVIQGKIKQLGFSNVSFVEVFRSVKGEEGGEDPQTSFSQFKFNYLQRQLQSPEVRYPNIVRDASFKMVFDSVSDSLVVKFSGTSVDVQQVVNEYNRYPPGLAVVFDLTRMKRFVEDDVLSLIKLIKILNSTNQNQQIIVAEGSMAYQKLKQMKLEKIYCISTIKC